MLRIAVIVFVVGLSMAARPYGRRSKLTCSGIPLRSFPNIDIAELQGVWFNKFAAITIPNLERPINVTVEFTVKSNRADEVIRGNNPSNLNECAITRFRDFQIYKNRPCFAEKGTDPLSCEDEEWIHSIVDKQQQTLVFFFCGDANPRPGRKCRRFIARCLSKTCVITRSQRKACRDAFRKFGIAELPPEDNASENNACSSNPGGNDYGRFIA